MVTTDKKSYVFTGKVWKYEGPAGWYFVYVSDRVSVAIKHAKQRTVGFGFVPVIAQIGKTAWETTVFPTKEGPYLVAIKSPVRKKESIAVGDMVRVRITLR